MWVPVTEPGSSVEAHMFFTAELALQSLQFSSQGPNSGNILHIYMSIWTRLSLPKLLFHFA